MIHCACGCGKQLEKFDNKGRPRKYIWGHHIMNDPRFVGKGRVPWNKGIKTGHIPWNKGRPWPEMSGENNPAWRGGVTKSRGERWSKEYRRWRHAVLRRDNHTCQYCGVNEESGVIIQTDHIKPWASYPELRYDINNGRTLCWDCHKKTKTYGMNGRKVLDVIQ